MKIKTSELSGVALDWAVAQAVDFPVQYTKRMGLHIARTMDVSAEQRFIRMGSRYCPSTDWSQGGPLIERFTLEIVRSHCQWNAVRSWYVGEPISWYPEGRTILIAACRAIVAAKLGDEVDVPEGLV